MNNRKAGNEFERQLCKTLSQKGFWTHNFAQSQAGQPADIIAVKNKIAYLIDCKVCKRDRFTLERIEENQALAMTLWAECGNGQAYFALKTTIGVYMISYALLENIDKNSLNIDDIQTLGLNLESWCEIANNYIK